MYYFAVPKVSHPIADPHDPQVLGSSPAGTFIFIDLRIVFKFHIFSKKKMIFLSFIIKLYAY